jgi:hypothetical protein
MVVFLISAAGLPSFKSPPNEIDYTKIKIIDCWHVIRKSQTKNMPQSNNRTNQLTSLQAASAHSQGSALSVQGLIQCGVRRISHPAKILIPGICHLTRNSPSPSPSPRLVIGPLY